MNPGLLTTFRDWLPVTDQTPALTLHEGATPLLRADRLAKWVGVDELYLKFDGLNPTGSFKDRGMVVAVAKALEEGARTIICASTGNTSASAAAYAARAGITCVVLLPAGKVALGKVAQAVAYGARIVTVQSNFDGALQVARDLSERHGAALVNSVNPYRIEGQTTAAFEICDALVTPPDVLALPVGNGGNITAYWLGFRRYHERGRVASLPRMLGAQASGAAPFVRGRPIEEPETVATAIRIGRPATWQPAIDAVRESKGQFAAVSDEQILRAYSETARMEGFFCEPASAASIAALKGAVESGVVQRSARCVCVLTGNGLKDPDIAVRQAVQVMELPADANAIARALRWE
jgi:threonine synthase